MVKRGAIMDIWTLHRQGLSNRAIGRRIGLDPRTVKKGSRNPVIGYKPQVGRTGQGFITTFEIQEGNPKDSTRLESLTTML